MAAAEALPPLFGALQRRELESLPALLGGPAGRETAQQTLPGGLTTMHAAALLGCADAVPLLAQAGAAVDAPRQGQGNRWQLIASMQLLLGPDASQQLPAAMLFDVSNSAGCRCKAVC